MSLIDKIVTHLLDTKHTYNHRQKGWNLTEPNTSYIDSLYKLILHNKDQILWPNIHTLLHNNKKQVLFYPALGFDDTILINLAL